MLVLVFLMQGSQGVICSSTNGFVIVATYDASMYPSVTVEAVEKLGKQPPAPPPPPP